MCTTMQEKLPDECQPLACLAHAAANIINCYVFKFGLVPVRLQLLRYLLDPSGVGLPFFRFIPTGRSAGGSRRITERPDARAARVR